MATTVPEISHLLTDCKAVATVYNVSAVKMKGVKEEARQNNTTVYQFYFPSVKNIRFTKYSYTLLSSILKKYTSMMVHLNDLAGAEATGLFSKWQGSELAAILCDVLFVYKRFQKLIQSDTLAVFDLNTSRQHCASEAMATWRFTNFVLYCY